jgi:hypothetical protein
MQIHQNTITLLVPTHNTQITQLVIPQQSMQKHNDLLITHHFYVHCTLRNDFAIDYPVVCQFGLRLCRESSCCTN